MQRVPHGRAPRVGMWAHGLRQVLDAAAGPALLLRAVQAAAAAPAAHPEALRGRGRARVAFRPVLAHHLNLLRIT